MELPNELDFSLDLPTDAVIESRTDVTIDSSSDTHSATNNSIIRLYMNGSGFVDPHSISIYGDFSMPGVTAADDVVPPPTYSLFETIRVIDGRGNVLEELNEAHLLAQKLHEASSDASFMDCTYGFTNSQKDPAKRVTSTTATNFRLAATDVLGIFSQAKLLHLPSFKGLQIELRLGQNNTVMTTRESTTAGTYQLQNVKLHYTEVQATRGYMEQYQAKLNDGGYAVAFPTYAHLQSSVGAGGDSQVALNKTASKVKAVFSTVRESNNRTSKQANSTASDSRVTRYQYQVNGKNYPPQPVDSKSKAYHELLKANGNRKDNRHSNICWDDFNNQWAFGATGKGADSIQYGTYAMWYDLEKSSDSPLSGVKMDANSSFLKISVDSGVSSPIVDTFVCFDRVLSVQPDRVVIVD